MNHALAPFTDAFPSVAHHLLAFGQDGIVSASHVLANALINPSDATFDSLHYAARIVGIISDDDGDRYLSAAYRTALAAVQTGNLSKDRFDTLADALRRSHSMPGLIGQPPPEPEASPRP
jgi:hypothetical protein